MRIPYRTLMAALSFAALTAASCGGSTPTPRSATPPIAKSPAPPPAKIVDTTVNSKGLRENREIDYAKPKGRTLVESAGLLESELLTYEPSLVVVSTQDGEGATAAPEIEKIETMLKAKGIVYILLTVPDYVAAPGYTPKPAAVYVVPSEAALDVFADKDARLEDKGRWTEFTHKKMGNALAELIVGAPLICCATGPVPENP